MKKPNIRCRPKGEKKPHAAFENNATQSPLWAFRYVDINRGGFLNSCCWSNLEADDIIDLIQHLKDFETMTWADIERGGSHFIEVRKIEKEAQERLVTLRQDDIDHLFSLRVSGKGRVWGIRNGGTLRLLWWDPQHEVCPSLLKHT